MIAARVSFVRPTPSENPQDTCYDRGGTTFRLKRFMNETELLNSKSSRKEEKKWAILFFMILVVYLGHGLFSSGSSYIFFFFQISFSGARSSASMLEEPQKKVAQHLCRSICSCSSIKMLAEPTESCVCRRRNPR